MKCLGCGEKFSEEELSLDGYCSNCDPYRCRSCGYVSYELDEEGVCYECNRDAAEDMYNARYDC